MKKIISILVLSLFVLISQAQPPTSKYTKVANGYNWLRGYFQALHLPVGNAPSLGIDQWTASGGIYLDTLPGDGTPEGLYLYIHGVWVLQGTGVIDQADKILNGGSVSYTGGGLVFNVTETLARLCNVIYQQDSTQVTLPPGDPDFNKQYVIYVDSTGIHVKEGEPGTPAAVPQLEACQFPLTSVLVEAGQTTPAITTQVIYDENTESTVANTGTTTNGANATNVFTGLVSTQVTNINTGDIITWTKVSGGYWSLSGVNVFSIAVLNRAQMATLSEIRVQFFNGTNAVSGEVIIAVNKNNFSTYQQISIPISAFGNITNLNFNIVRIRYSSNNITNFTGYYFDRLELVSGLTVVSPGSAVTSVGITVGGNLYNVTNSPIVNSGNLVLTPAGTADQYVNGQGIRILFPNFPRAIGPIDGRAKNDDGLTLDDDTLFTHLADRYNNGMLSKENWIKLNRGDTIQNIGDGDSILVLVNDSTIGAKSIKIIGASKVITDSTIEYTVTGGSSLTGGEGTVISGDSIHLGGLIGSPSLLQAERTINTNRKIFHWTNGLAAEAGGAYWQFTQRPYSPYQFISKDTVSVNDALPTIGRPLSGLYARRIIHFNSGIYKAQQVYGHYAGLTYNWFDSVVIRNDGMDYGQALIAETRFQPLNSGYQVVRLANGTGNDLRKLHATPTFLSNTYYDGKDGASTDTLYGRGTSAGIISYLVAATGTGKVRGKEHIYFQAGNLVNSNSHFDRSVVLSRQTTETYTDTSYFLWDTLRTSRNMMNKTVIGFGDSTQSGYEFKVYGTTWQKGAWRYTDGSEGASKVLTSDASGNATWTTPGAGGITSFGSPGAGNANGGSVSGSVGTLHYGTATSPGILSITSQQISGNKTFNNLLIAGDELRIENTYRLRDISNSGFYDYFQPAILSMDHQYYFADDDNSVDTIATRAWARTNGGGGGGGGGSGTVNTGTANRLAYYPASTAAVDDLAAITANRALISDANGLPTHATTTATQVGYLSTTTSDIQTQLDAKQDIIAGKRYFWIGPAATTTITTVGTNAATSSGTLTTPAIASTSLLTSTRRTSYSSGASAGSVARVNFTTLEIWRGNAAGLGGFTFLARFGLNTTVTGNRVFVGVIDNVTPPANLDLTTNTATARVGMTINASTGNWQFATNTSGVAPTLTDLGANFAVNTTDLLELKMVALPNAGTYTYTVTNLSTGNISGPTTVSSNLPASTSFLTGLCWITNNAQASAAIIDLAKMYIETNY